MHAPQPTPSPSRFELIDDDQIRDTATGLSWTRRNVSAKPLPWAKAEAECKALTLGGHDDWRLPSRAELLTLVDDTRFRPAIDPAFECSSGWYWTATAYAGAPADSAWSVGFGYGDANCCDRGGSGFVRAVRGGQF